MLFTKKQIRHARHRCEKCMKQLNALERMNNGACCPYCGYTVEGTICDTIKDSVCVEHTYLFGILPVSKKVISSES